MPIISVRGRVWGCCGGVIHCVGWSGCGSVNAGMHWYINLLPVCLRLCARLCWMCGSVVGVVRLYPWEVSIVFLFVPFRCA